MEHLTILVSPEGRWVLPGTSEFFAALGDPDPDYDAVSFAVRNLGFIKFEVIRQSIVEIELHPRNVELPALLAVQQQLLSSDLRLFRIKYFDDELAFRDLLLGRGDDRAPVRAVPAAFHAVGARPVSRRAAGFRNAVRGRATTSCASSRRNGASRSGISTRTSSPWRCTTNCCRGWRSSASSRGRRIRYGAFSATAIAGWAAATIFRQVSARRSRIFPDKDYGEWASAFYRSVAESGRPRYDLITTSVQYRDEAGQAVAPGPLRDGCCCPGKRRPTRFLSRCARNGSARAAANLRRRLG